MDVRRGVLRCSSRKLRSSSFVELVAATEFGLGIMREADVCGGYAMGPSGE